MPPAKKVSSLTPVATSFNNKHYWQTPYTPDVQNIIQDIKFATYKPFTNYHNRKTDTLARCRAFIENLMDADGELLEVTFATTSKLWEGHAARHKKVLIDTGVMSSAPVRNYSTKTKNAKVYLINVKNASDFIEQCSESGIKATNIITKLVEDKEVGHKVDVSRLKYDPIQGSIIISKTGKISNKKEVEQKLISSLKETELYKKLIPLAREAAEYLKDDTRLEPKVHWYVTKKGWLKARVAFRPFNRICNLKKEERERMFGTSVSVLDVNASNLRLAKYAHTGDFDTSTDDFYKRIWDEWCMKVSGHKETFTDECRTAVKALCMRSTYTKKESIWLNFWRCFMKGLRIAGKKYYKDVIEKFIEAYEKVVAPCGTVGKNTFIAELGYYIARAQMAKDLKTDIYQVYDEFIVMMPNVTEETMYDYIADVFKRAA